MTGRREFVIVILLNGKVLTLSGINGEEVYGDNEMIEVPNGKLRVNNLDDITFIPVTDYFGFAIFFFRNAKCSRYL